ncbi:MAG: 4-(cytidine 5'-diphospho)-2-C-methyl-D-erythritol kinase, partial [Candidatus Bipolaricaulota bacterium]
MEALRVRAYAKLNLGLRVVGRRANGYHLLQSTMVAVDLADTLSFTRQRAGVTVSCRPGLGISPEKNLVSRAVSAALSRAGAHTGVKVVVHKHIPPGAGLGGGSSDAAAALSGTNLLLDLGLSQAQLAELALTLGADVPFFLGPSPAWAEGVGERLRPSPARLPPAFLLLVPPRRCPTSQVFQRYAELGIPYSHPSAPPVFPDYRNDLYPAALEVYPELSQYLELLDQAEALGVGMTGSGSGLFAAYLDRAAAQGAKER